MELNETKSDWESTKEQNLVRYRPSGKYFARFKVGGKLIRKSLKTTVFSVAKLRLPDEIKKHRAVQGNRKAFGNGKMTFGDAVQIYQDKLEINADLTLRCVTSPARKGCMNLAYSRLCVTHTPPVAYVADRIKLCCQVRDVDSLLSKTVYPTRLCEARRRGNRDGCLQPQIQKPGKL